MLALTEASYPLPKETHVRDPAPQDGRGAHRGLPPARLPGRRRPPKRAAAALDPFTGYLMAHFTGESANGEQIYLAHSDDGLHWTDLNNGQLVLRSTIGTRGVRDPSIVRSPSGDRYWIVATDLRIASGTSWNDAANRGSTSLVVWESRDLVNWSAPPGSSTSPAPSPARATPGHPKPSTTPRPATTCSTGPPTRHATG
ncbi:hypothetical protein GCM10020001_006030 [Nonomuraea salmonea]